MRGQRQGRHSLAAALSAAALVASGSARADWPERPVRLLIAGPAGGLLDAVGRIVGERLAARHTQPFVPDFRPGASGLIVADQLLRSAPDGYTLMVAAIGVATEVPHMFQVLFDPLRDLHTVAELGRSTLVLVGNRGVRAPGLKELLVDARERPAAYRSRLTATARCRTPAAWC